MQMLWLHAPVVRTYALTHELQKHSEYHFIIPQTVAMKPWSWLTRLGGKGGRKIIQQLVIS
jgi:hypothetical protein